MATRTAALDRKETASPSGKPRRPRAKAPAKSAEPRVPPPPGAWPRAWRAGLVAMLLGGLTALAGAHFAGHAISWRSLTVVAIQSLPLLPGMALFWRLMEALRGRFSGLPLMLWLALVAIGSIGAMLVASGLIFAIHNRALAFSEDHDGEMKLIHHLIGTVGAFYLYGATAFRLWWPWGAAIPAAMTLMFWRAHRR